MVNIFQTLKKNLTKSEKHFKSFRLNNTFITELKENTFKDITFEEITIIRCNNLSKIHLNAFSKTYSVTKILSISLNSKLSSTENSIFEVISEFVYLEDLQIEGNNITEIPSNAFQRIGVYQDNFQTLVFSGESIKKIGSRAFHSLRRLNYLHIYDTSIDYIPEYAFEFEEESNQRITLRLGNNKFLNSSSFHQDSLSHFKRPVYIDLGSVVNHFEYLDEKVFENFLNANHENRIDMTWVNFDCNNCNNFWLSNQPNLLKRFIGLECANKMNFTDPVNFVKCAAWQSLKPCIFEKNKLGERVIFCGGETDIDLTAIFHNFSKQLSNNEKHFNRFVLNNNFITELKENTFKDITFDDIRIFICVKLTKIDINTFAETNLVTQSLSIYSNPKLNSNNNSIFEVISKFVNLEDLYLQGNNITEIPSNAFQRKDGKQGKLSNLNFGGESIKIIGSRAFSALSGLKSLTFQDTSIDYISEYAFEFEEESYQRMTLDLGKNNLLNSSCFHQESLTHFKRPVDLLFGWPSYQFKYLDEKVFKNFLISNPQNRINMIGANFDCNDCKNFWLRKQPNLMERLLHLKCSNNKNFNDPDNFAECVSYQSLTPCTYEKNTWGHGKIFCGGKTDIDLKSIFHNFSKQLSNNEKHFETFHLNNSYIKVLEENTFDEITFDTIEINSCYNLTNIERYAFNNTVLVTKHLILSNNSKLSMDNTIYDILSSFVNIERIEIPFIGLNEIPSKAFRPINGYQERLKFLLLGQGFTIIGKNSFSNLKNLDWLSFLSAKFTKMPDYTFEFEEYSNKTFHIEFVWDLNINSAFNEKTLLNIRRPTTLYLRGLHSVTYLDEKVFLPFLLEDQRNSIELTMTNTFDNVFDCNDCRNYWLKKNKNINKNCNIICSNNKYLNDPDNFKKCYLFT